MTPREKQIFFNGMMAALAAAKLDAFDDLLTRIVHQWEIDPDPQASPVFKEIAEEMRAIGYEPEEPRQRRRRGD